MTIPVCDLISCVNTSIAAVTTCDLTLLQLSSVARDFDTSWVRSVQDVASLPDATLNTGRMIYVQSVCGYRISDGVTWSNDFTSILQDAVLWAWGNNVSGRLGDNTTTGRSSPVSVVGGFSDWSQPSAGHCHNLAVRTSGSAWAWGCGSSGVLGNNTITDTSSPVSVVGGLSDWCQVSAGCVHSVAVRTSGSAWAWGTNTSGRLGDNTTTDRSSPVSVVGGFSDWCQVSAGFFWSVAIRRTGSAWAWGSNAGGWLGNNTTITTSSPVSVVGGFSDWCQIEAGNRHTVAVRTSGSTWSWGENSRGQLGDNTTTSASSPVSVVGGFSDWCQVSAGRYFNVALRTNGSAWSWGDNFAGKLGDNTTTSRSSPVSVVGGFTNWCQASAGEYHAVGVITSGTAWAWGRNNVSQLGDNTTTAKSSPVSVVGGISDWYDVSAGACHTLALNATRGFA